MRTPLLYTILAGLLVTASLAAQQQDQERQKEKEQPGEELLNLLGPLEEEVWQALVKGEADVLKKLLADDYREIGGPVGDQLTRPELLERLPSLRILEYREGNVLAAPLTKDVGLLTYEVAVVGSLNSATRSRPPGSTATASGYPRSGSGPPWRRGRRR
jgi:hypothetical protein